MVFFQHARPVAKLSALGTILVATLFSSLAQAEWAYNFQEPVTEVAGDIYDLHMLIFWMCLAIFVGVFSVMFYSIFAHRKSKNFKPSQFSHSTSVEIVWTIIPFFILIAFAIPATIVLIKLEDTTKSDLTIKITGYQWKWGYEYLDSDISFYSTLTTPREQIDQFDKENAVEQGENYLLETDNMVVVPSGRKVRALITANDVIHAWWIPAFGVKKDAIPGYINEIWFNVIEGKEGIYRGQCAELCGKDHAYMPIVVKVVTGAEFDAWVAAGGSFDASKLAENDEEDGDNASAFDGSVITVIEDSEPEAEEQPVEKMPEEAAGDAPESNSAAQSVIEAIVPAANAADESAEAENDSSESTWTKEALIAKGEEVSASCNVCHGADGAGGAGGMFPAITGSAVATGPVEEHKKIVMFGKPGTAMAAFAGQLSDEELAAVITYQRNAFGNETGDVVLPADIKALRN